MRALIVHRPGMVTLPASLTGFVAAEVKPARILLTGLFFSSVSVAMGAARSRVRHADIFSRVAQWLFLLSARVSSRVVLSCVVLYPPWIDDVFFFNKSLAR